MTKRLLFTAVFSAVVMAFGFSAASAQTDEVKAVTDVMMREAVAVEKGDLAALDKIWANTEDVTVFESGHANYGWNDYRNTHLAPELKDFKNTKYSFSDMKIKVEGKDRLGDLQIRSRRRHGNAKNRERRTRHRHPRKTRRQLANSPLALKRTATSTGRDTGRDA